MKLYPLTLLIRSLRFFRLKFDAIWITILLRDGGRSVRKVIIKYRSGPKDGREEVFSSHTIGMGRDPQCDIVFDDPTVSLNHAEIRFENGRYLVRDLDSTNGTYLNGEEIQQAYISSGDILALSSMGSRVEIGFPSQHGARAIVLVVVFLLAGAAGWYVSHLASKSERSMRAKRSAGENSAGLSARLGLKEPTGPSKPIEPMRVDAQRSATPIDPAEQERPPEPSRPVFKQEPAPDDANGLSGKPNRLLLEGKRLLAKHRYNEALKKFQEAATRNPSDASVYYYMGLCYSRRGQLEKAKDYFESSLKRDANFPAAHLELGLLYDRNANYSKALYHLDKALAGGVKAYPSRKLMGQIAVVRQKENIIRNAPYSVAATHKHASLAGSCKGTFVVSKEGVYYKSKNATHHFKAAYRDIKKIRYQTDKLEIYLRGKEPFVLALEPQASLKPIRNLIGLKMQARSHPAHLTFLSK